MAGAAVAQPDYLGPMVTAGATVVTAVISGFFAAALRHRWETQDQWTRWRHESWERTHSARLEAFATYLAKRPTRQRVADRLARLKNNEPAGLPLIEDDLELAAARLSVVIDSAADQQVIEADATAVLRWLALVKAQGLAGSGDPPPRGEILTLARKYAADPDLGARERRDRRQ